LDASIFDMTPFIKTDKSKKSRSSDAPSNKNRAMHVSVQANKMLADNGTALTKSKMYLELNKASQPTRIEMDANVGKGVLNVRFMPDGQNNRNFKLETTDAGYTLKSFGLYDKIRGGKMSISGRPKKGTTSDDLYGQAQLTNFSVKGAPALAKLISATSIKGVEALIDNDGLTFEKLASEFEWKFKDTGNLLVVKEGRTSGSSLGLTFEGIVNMGDGHMDLSGTIIPLAGVNKVIGQIPVIGDILTGGDALFAATYKMKGASNDPKISLNPLSVLAPGFLRKVLFESDVEKKVKKEERKK